jgi:NTE family protein
MAFEQIGDKKVGVVLSGGGVRGMAHIGLLEVMDALGIRPAFISGTSVGAIVGALYAQGIGFKEMLDFFRKTPLFRYNFLTINKPGLIDTERYIEVFTSYFPGDSFDNFPIDLFVTTTNLQKGTQEVFNKGELIRPLLASAALPPVFSPLEMNGCLYADGGILNNFPSEPIADLCEVMIGSNVSLVREIDKGSIRTSFQLANRTTALMVYAINHQKIASCNILFEPQELEIIGVFDKKSLERAYQIGYEYAMRTFKKMGY